MGRGSVSQMCRKLAGLVLRTAITCLLHRLAVDKSPSQVIGHCLLWSCTERLHPHKRRVIVLQDYQIRHLASLPEIHHKERQDTWQDRSSRLTSSTRSMDHIVMPCGR